MIAVNSKAAKGIKMFVYALCEPDGKKIRYIGVTANLKKRFQSHTSHPSAQIPLLRKWVLDLRREGLLPSMIVLAQCYGTANGLKEEARQIAAHEGDNLLNHREVQNKKRRRYFQGSIEYGGECLSVSQWAHRLNISKQALVARLNTYPVETAVSTPRGVSCLSNGGAPTPPFPATIGSEEIAIESLDVGSKQSMLTHAERRERRARMAAAVSSGNLVASVAAMFQVTTVTVRNAMKEHGVPG